MRRLGWFLVTCIAIVCGAQPATAQLPDDSRTEASSEESLSGLPTGSTVTPEMWFYMQEYRRHQSPKEAVRRKAELRSAQRQQRLESQRWFGFTNLRPPANPIPLYGTYSPMWTGSARDPYAWIGIGQSYVTYHTATRAN